MSYSRNKNNYSFDDTRKTYLCCSNQNVSYNPPTPPNKLALKENIAKIDCELLELRKKIYQLESRPVLVTTKKIPLPQYYYENNINKKNNYDNVDNYQSHYTFRRCKPADTNKNFLFSKFSFEILRLSNNFDEKLQKAMEVGSTADVCASAGYLLEYMCEKLSVILSTSIKRKYGDRYTIGDLWPGIFKELKKTQGKVVFTELNDLLYLRNMVGSHYNEWSLSLSRAEANDFAKAVLDSYYLVCCRKCGRWIKDISEIGGTDFLEFCCDKDKRKE